MNYIEFFTTDNKSGKKYKPDWLSKFHPEIFEIINEFSVKNNLVQLPFRQQAWLFLNNKIEIPKCLNCENKTIMKK